MFFLLHFSYLLLKPTFISFILHYFQYAFLHYCPSHVCCVVHIRLTVTGAVPATVAMTMTMTVAVTMDMAVTVTVTMQ